MSVNTTKKTPAVAGGRGHGGRGQGGRGRSKELPIPDHAAVGEDVVETPTRSPSSSPQVSPTRSRSGSGESRVDLMLASQAYTASKIRKHKLADGRLLGGKPNAMGQDGDPVQETISQKKLPGRNRLTQWRRKSLTCRAVLRACETTSHALTSCPSPGLGSGFSLRGSCGHAEDALPA